MNDGRNRGDGEADAAVVLEEAARGFDDPDEQTSPEVLRPPTKATEPAAPAPQSLPVALVGSEEPATLRTLTELLEGDGWLAVPVTTMDDLVYEARVRRPHLVLADVRLSKQSWVPAPEYLRSHLSESGTRILAVMSAEHDAQEIARVVADGFDDFIQDLHNPVEVLARCTANLRACRSLQDLYKQRREAASLLELSQTLASSLDLQSILHTVSRQIADVIALERCSIILLDPDSDDAIMVAASDDRSVRDLRLQLSNYPELKRCVETGAPVIIEDTESDPLLNHVRRRVSAAGVRTMVLFPIVFEHRVTGVLFLRSTKPGQRLSSYDIQFGQTVSSACAVAIRNARLFDSIRDQTERMNYMRLAAEQQMEGLKKYEDFFEYAADGMAIVNAAGEILYVNREGRRLLGSDSDTWNGLRFSDFIAEESKARWQEVITGAKNGKERRYVDVYFIHRDGAERVFWLSAGSVGREDDVFVLSFRDVTETREMELELRTTKDFLENLIDNSVDAIVASDMRGNVMLFNKGAELIYGYRAEDVVGKMHVSDLYPERMAHEIMRQLRDNRFGGRGRLAAQRRSIRNIQGEMVPVSMSASLIYEDGEEVATVGVFTDLRDRVQIEQRLSDAQEELLRSEKARVAADLAGMAAHELNQPLTSVLGYAEMLRHRIDPKEEKVRRCVDTIYGQAERMAEIVRKIGRITKYETKHYGARTTMMDLERASAPDANEEDVTSKNQIPPLEGQRAEETQPRAIDPRQHAQDSEEGAPSALQFGQAPYMAALASVPKKDDAKIRAAIVRPDTVDPPSVRQRFPEDVTDPGNRQRAYTAPPPRSAVLMEEFDLEDEPPETERTNPGVRYSDLSTKSSGPKT